MTPGPHSRKCTSYLLCGPGGMPLALRLSEGLGITLADNGKVLSVPLARLLLMKRPGRIPLRAAEPDL